MSATERQDIEAGIGEVPSEAEEVKLVPVGESIRYRRRAQSAEKQAEALRAELAEARRLAAEASAELAEVRRERELVGKLATAGALDLEAAVLVAKAKMEQQPEAGADAVIEQLRREKAYLFSSSGSAAVASRKTSGARDRTGSGRAALERAAKRAATTGGRAELQEYLRLRRSLL